MTCGLLVLAAGRALIAAAHTIPVLSKSQYACLSRSFQAFSLHKYQLCCKLNDCVTVAADLLVALGGATSGSVLPSLFSLEAPPGGVGTLLGIGQSVHSAAGVVGPLASGFLFDRYLPCRKTPIFA